MNQNIDFKIDKKTVVHAKTAEESNNLCKLLDKLGATLCTDTKYTKIDLWDTYEVDTCYNVHKGSFGKVSFYTDEGFNIISTKEFLKLHGIKTK